MIILFYLKEKTNPILISSTLYISQAPTNTHVNIKIKNIQWINQTDEMK
jgi:hypothetical protein